GRVRRTRECGGSVRGCVLGFVYSVLSRSSAGVGTRWRVGAAVARRPLCLLDAAGAAGVVVFFQAEDGIRDWSVTGVQTCALPIYVRAVGPHMERLLGEPRGAVGLRPHDQFADVARLLHQMERF